MFVQNEFVDVVFCCGFLLQFVVVVVVCEYDVVEFWVVVDDCVVIEYVVFVVIGLVIFDVQCFEFWYVMCECWLDYVVEQVVVDFVEWQVVWVVIGVW